MNYECCCIHKKTKSVTQNTDHGKLAEALFLAQDSQTSNTI